MCRTDCLKIPEKELFIDNEVKRSDRRLTRFEFKEGGRIWKEKEWDGIKGCCSNNLCSLCSKLYWFNLRAYLMCVSVCVCVYVWKREKLCLIWKGEWIERTWKYSTRLTVILYNICKEKEILCTAYLMLNNKYLPYTYTY